MKNKQNKTYHSTYWNGPKDRENIIDSESYPKRMLDACVYSENIIW